MIALWRRILSLALPLLTMSTVNAYAATTGTPDWTRTEFLGAPAWQSQSGNTLAIVSEQRCRLLYLGTADRSLNLLSAPAKPAEPTPDNSAPNWGGHRFWLGPQARWIWPPLKGWEFSAAAKCSTSGGELSLSQPSSDANYPDLTRSYAWEGTRLRCTVSWKDDGRAYYGMHVVAVDAPAEISAVPTTSPTAPEGVVAVRIDGFDTTGITAHPAARRNGTALAFRTGSERNAKVGFTPQPLRCVRAAGWTLVMHPGPSTGVPIGASDAGHLTQLWVGQPHVPFAELEQLSPILLGDKDGLCSSTCFLEASKE